MGGGGVVKSQDEFVQNGTRTLETKVLNKYIEALRTYYVT